MTIEMVEEPMSSNLWHLSYRALGSYPQCGALSVELWTHMQEHGIYWVGVSCLNEIFGIVSIFNL